jgi:hypothetical protein
VKPSGTRLSLREAVAVLREYLERDFSNSYIADPVTLSPVPGSFKRRPWHPAIKEAVAALDTIEEALGA